MPDLPDAAQALLDAGDDLANLLEETGRWWPGRELTPQRVPDALAKWVALRAALAAASPEDDVCPGSGQEPMTSGGGYQPPHFEGLCTVCEQVAPVDDGLVEDHPVARPEDDYDEQDVKVTYLTPGDIATARQATEIQAAASPPAPTDDDLVAWVTQHQEVLGQLAKVFFDYEEATEVGPPFISNGHVIDAVRRVFADEITGRPAPPGLCPVCGQWPHNCDPQVDHGGSDA